jgi:hypothetical protein
MTGSASHRNLSWLGVFVLLIGVVVAANSVRRITHVRRLTERRVRDLRAMQALEAQVQQALSAQAALAGMPTTPAPMAQLATAPGTPQPEVSQSRTEAAPGWARWEAQVTWSAAPFDAARQLVITAERQEPPWRLTNAVFEASQRAGSGKVTLHFTALTPAPAL